MRQPVCKCLRGHVAGVGKRKQMAITEQFVRARIYDQQRGNAFQFVDAVMPGDLVVLVDVAAPTSLNERLAVEASRRARQSR